MKDIYVFNTILKGSLKVSSLHVWEVQYFKILHSLQKDNQFNTALLFYHLPIAKWNMHG